MKNFCVLCIVFVVVTFLASSPADAQVRLGARGGLNLASASISPDLSLPGVSISTSNRTGLFFGGIAEFGISGPVFIQVEPQYVQRGKKYEGSQSGVTATLTLKVDYIEVPVLLKAKFSAGGIAPYAFIGPSISFFMSAKQQTEVEAPPPIGNQSQTDDIKEEFTSTAFGLDFGAGIELPVAPTLSLLIDGRYGLGLNDILKDTDVTGKYRDIKIGVGLLFGL